MRSSMSPSEVSAGNPTAKGWISGNPDRDCRRSTCVATLVANRVPNKPLFRATWESNGVGLPSRIEEEEVAGSSQRQEFTKRASLAIGADTRHDRKYWQRASYRDA